MQALLNDCRQIEDLAHRIYRRLAERQEFAGEVRGAFRELAADEREHARQLERALQVPQPEQLGLNRIAWAKIDEALQMARKALAEVEAAPCSEEAALRLAITLEENFVKVHLDNAVHFHDPRLADLFGSLGRSDKEHLEVLRSCLQWWHRRRRNKVQSGSSN